MTPSVSKKNNFSAMDDKAVQAYANSRFLCSQIALLVMAASVVFLFGNILGPITVLGTMMKAGVPSMMKALGIVIGCGAGGIAGGFTQAFFNKKSQDAINELHCRGIVTARKVKLLDLSYKMITLPWKAAKDALEARRIAKEIREREEREAIEREKRERAEREEAIRKSVILQKPMIAPQPLNFNNLAAKAAPIQTGGFFKKLLMKNREQRT